MIQRPFQAARRGFFIVTAPTMVLGAFAFPEPWMVAAVPLYTLPLSVITVGVLLCPRPWAWKAWFACMVLVFFPLIWAVQRMASSRKLDVLMETGLLEAGLWALQVLLAALVLISLWGWCTHLRGRPRAGAWVSPDGGHDGAGPS